MKERSVLFLFYKWKKCKLGEETLGKVTELVSGGARIPTQVHVKVTQGSSTIVPPKHSQKCSDTRNFHHFQGAECRFPGALVSSFIQKEEIMFIYNTRMPPESSTPSAQWACNNRKFHDWLNIYWQLWSTPSQQLGQIVIKKHKKGQQKQCLTCQVPVSGCQWWGLTGMEGKMSGAWGCQETEHELNF